MKRIKFKINDRVTAQVGGEVWKGLVIQVNPAPTGECAVRVSWDQQERSEPKKIDDYGPDGYVKNRHTRTRPTSGWLKETLLHHECPIKALGDIVSADG
jgi:hypothetical protein